MFRQGVSLAKLIAQKKKGGGNKKTFAVTKSRVEQNNREVEYITPANYNNCSI